MKIGVLVKRVPDTEFKVKLQGSGVDTGEAKWVMNPYDEFGVEEALKLQKTHGGEVVVVTFGSAKADEILRNALAMGADRAVRVDDAGVEGSDVGGVGEVLAAVCRKEGFEIVFAGKQAIDDQEVQVPQIVAELLDWPHATSVEAFEAAADGKKVTAHRPVGGGAVEVIELELPAVISADKGLNTPRYASLPNIMKAKKKPLDVLTAAALGVNAARLGASGAKVKVTGYQLPPERKAGRKIEGADVRAMAQNLVKALHEEAKVI